MLTAKQAEAVTATGSVAVTAGAGSGKTFLLTERYVHLVTQGLSPLEVVATTFTRKAAAELKSRIRTRMQGAALSPEVQAELEAAQISTMDALAARICHDFPLEANVPADFTVMDEQEAILFKARYFEEAMAQVPQVCFAHMPYSVLRDVLEALMFDPIAAQEALAKDASDWEAYAEQVRE